MARSVGEGTLSECYCSLCSQQPECNCMQVRSFSLLEKRMIYLKINCFLLRFLEEGNLEAAAAEKQRVEELQRSRRRYMEENNLEHIPKFFK